MDNNQADQVVPEVGIQVPILVMGLQETPTGKCGLIKGWPHLEYAGKNGLRLLATVSTITKRRYTHEEKTIFLRK